MELLTKVLTFLSRWADEKDWHSWVIHTVGAIPIGLLSVLLFWVLTLLQVPLYTKVATVTTFVFFGARETEQIAHKIMNKIKPRLRDPIMDVICPTVGVFLFWTFVL